MSRGDLTDAEWHILNPLLPDRGEHGPAVAFKRRTVNGILWVLRTGAPWRDLPKRYGNWNSVFLRFTRWSKLGVWDAVFETLASLGPPAGEEHAIDSTIVRAHQCSRRKRGNQDREALGRSRGGFSMAEVFRRAQHLCTGCPCRMALPWDAFLCRRGAGWLAGMVVRRIRRRSHYRRSYRISGGPFPARWAVLHN